VLPMVVVSGAKRKVVGSLPSQAHHFVEDTVEEGDALWLAVQILMLGDPCVEGMVEADDVNFRDVQRQGFKGVCAWCMVVASGVLHQIVQLVPHHEAPFVANILHQKLANSQIAHL